MKRIKRIVALLLIIFICFPTIPIYAAAPTPITVDDAGAQKVDGWYMIVKADGADYVTPVYLYGSQNKRWLGVKLKNKENKERTFKFTVSIQDILADGTSTWGGQVGIKSSGTSAKGILARDMPKVDSTVPPYQADKGAVKTDIYNASTNQANMALLLRDLMTGKYGINVDDTEVITMYSTTGRTGELTIGSALESIYTEKYNTLNHQKESEEFNKVKLTPQETPVAVQMKAGSKGVDKTQEMLAIKSAIGTFAAKSTAPENPTSGTVTSASRLKSVAKTSSATYQKAKQDKQANVSNAEKNKAKNTSDKVEIDDNPDSTFGYSEETINAWYNSAMQVLVGTALTEKEEFKSASNLYKDYGSLTAEQKKAWDAKAYDILSLAYAEGVTDSVKAFDPNMETLRKAYKNLSENNSGTMEYRLTDVEAESMRKNLVEHMDASTSGEDVYARLTTFEYRVRLLLSAMTTSESNVDRQWISVFYKQDSPAISTNFPFSDYYQKGFIQFNNKSPKYLVLNDGDSTLPMEAQGYLIATILELQYFRDQLLAQANNDLSSGSIKDNLDLLNGLKGVNKIIEKYPFPLLKDLWEKQGEEFKDLPCKSLKELYDKLLEKGIFDKIDGIASQQPKVLETGKPLGDWMDYEEGKEKLSDYYLKGIAYSAAMIPMKTNVYSQDWLNFLDDDFKKNFHNQWGYNRKALYFDSSSSAAQTYFVTGTANPNKVLTLKDFLNAKNDMVVFVDDNFYNADTLGFDKLDFSGDIQVPAQPQTQPYTQPAATQETFAVSPAEETSAAQEETTAAQEETTAAVPTTAAPTTAASTSRTRTRTNTTNPNLPANPVWQSNSPYSVIPNLTTGRLTTTPALPPLRSVPRQSPKPLSKSILDLFMPLEVHAEPEESTAETVPETQAPTQSNVQVGVAPTEEWAYMADLISNNSNLSADSVLKNNDETNYSKIFLEKLQNIQGAIQYFPQATLENPGNPDRAVLNSGQINYYLRASNAGSEVYTPLQGYAVVSSVYRDIDLYNLANSSLKRYPVFIASEKAGKAKNSSDDAKASIFNYALMRNLKDSMAVEYTGNLDMNSPLYLDIYGNILTESGTVVVPAASNPTLMSSSDFFRGDWSAGLFSIYGNGYKIKADDEGSFSNVLDATFQVVDGYWMPKSRILGNSYVIDMSRLSTASKDTLDVLYTQTYVDLHNSNETQNKYYSFKRYVNIILEVLRGAPIENIDKAKEGLDTSNRIDKAGIVAAAKLEQLNDSLNIAGENTTISLPQISNISVFNVVSIIIFKAMMVILVAVSIVTIYIDAVKSQMGLGTIAKIIGTGAIMMSVVLIVPALFDITYYQSNRALLQDEATYLSMLNLEKEESGVEIGMTEVREPHINTNLQIQLDDITVPWYIMFSNVMTADTGKTLDNIWQEHAQTQSFIFNNDDVVIKHNGVYMDVSQIYESTSIDIDTTMTSTTTKRNLVQTAKNKTSTFSYYSPYYAILDALIRNVNTYNANPWEPEENVTNVQGWYSYTTKVQRGGRVKSMGLIAPYFKSERFMSDENKDILGFYHMYSNLYQTDVQQDPALDGLYDSNLQNIRASNWYPTGIANQDVIKRIDWLTKQARDFVAKNENMLGKVSDETFLKAMALNLAIKHNQVFGNRYASSIDIANLSNDDLLRLSVAKKNDVMMTSTLTFPRFVYETGGTFAVVVAMILSVTMKVSSILKPAAVILTFALIFFSVFIIKICMRKKEATYLGYIVTILLLCLTNIAYSLMLKITLFLPTLFPPAVCIIIQILLQVGYLFILGNVIYYAAKDWHDMAAFKYMQKVEALQMKIRDSFTFWRKGEGSTGFGGSTRISTPEKNHAMLNEMFDERERRIK
jgi:hypothetical protein